jgi:hypothetical protein
MAFAADPTTVEPTLEDSFNTVTYTGTGTNQQVTGIGFEPDFVWIKSRTTTNPHVLHDTVRGIGNVLYSNLTNAEADESLYFTGVGDGFLQFGVNAGNYNNTGTDYVAWAWKGAELPAINSNGSIPSVVSANPAAGFSIVSWTGDGNGLTVGHGLGIAPKITIRKKRNNTSGWTFIFDGNIVGDSGLKFMELNTTAAAQTAGQQPHTDTTFGLYPGFDNTLNATWIAYCFAEVAGFSKFGSHTTAAKITTGFEPAWVMIKYTGATSDWWIMDLARWDGTSYGSNGGKLIKPYLEANTSDAEGSVGTGSIEVMSDGFYPTNFFNAGGAIHMAFANQF